MKLYVIRHGETDVNIENKINALNDDDLNENGIKQAKEVAKTVQKIDYDFIIASPLTRTKHTAKLLNAKNKEIILDNRLMERDAGQFTKKSLDEIDCNDWWSINPKNDYLDAEKVEDVIKRVYDFLEEIISNYPDKNIILVTHGGTSKVINSYFKGIPEDGILERYEHNNCEIQVFEGNSRLKNV